MGAGCNSKQVALPSQIGATTEQCTAALPSASVAKYSTLCNKACVSEVTEIGTDVEAGKKGRQEQRPTTILLVEPPPALLLLQPPQQPTHSLLAREASVSYQIARGLNSEMDLFSEGESKTQEAGAQHSLKQG